MAQGYDFEEALQQLPADLEARGLHLLCNRYRRNALVTSLARQMGDGLSCYLVRPRRPVADDQIIDSLGPAEASDVVSAKEAAASIARWRARPPLFAFLMHVVRSAWPGSR